MRLNMDCVRQILLCIEEHTGLRKPCFFIDSGQEESVLIIGDSIIPPPEYQSKLLKKYDNDELIYHLNYCIKANLISADGPFDQYQTFITDLTPKGHDFLENIRDNKVWSGIKSIAAKVGATSLESVVQISSNVITQLIKAQFGI